MSGCYCADQADGVLSYAAVPHVGLGPTIPPLRRYAEYTVDQILEAWWVFTDCKHDAVTGARINNRRNPTLFAAQVLGLDGEAA